MEDVVLESDFDSLAEAELRTVTGGIAATTVVAVATCAAAGVTVGGAVGTIAYHATN